MTILYLALSINLLLNSQYTQKDTLLFNGTSLDNWEIIDFEEHGPVSIVDSCVLIGKGKRFQVSGGQVISQK